MDKLVRSIATLAVVFTALFGAFSFGSSVSAQVSTPQCDYLKSQTNHLYVTAQTNWVDQDNPTVNHSGSATIKIQNKDANDLHQKQAYFRFNVSAPAGKVFSGRAYLCIWIDNQWVGGTSGAPYGWTVDTNAQGANWNTKPTATNREKCLTNIQQSGASSQPWHTNTSQVGYTTPPGAGGQSGYANCFANQMANINGGAISGVYNFALIGGDGSLLEVPGAGDANGHQPFLDIEYV